MSQTVTDILKAAFIEELDRRVHEYSKLALKHPYGSIIKIQSEAKWKALEFLKKRLDRYPLHFSRLLDEEIGCTRSTARAELRDLKRWLDDKMEEVGG